MEGNMTACQTFASNAGGTHGRKNKRELEGELNEGLKNTFRASDPVSTNRTDDTPDRLSTAATPI